MGIGCLGLVINRQLQMSRRFPIKPLLLIVGFLIFTQAMAGDRVFVHPGALVTRECLDFVKAEIAAGNQPWTGEFDRIKSSRPATRGPNMLLHVDGHDDAATARDDALAAYTQALLWYFSDDHTYAKRAITILNAWSGFEGFTMGSDQDKLHAGWVGAVFAQAAEIMRVYDGWQVAQINDFQLMFKRAFYPQLKSASSWNGNVDLTQVDAMMSIAVFNEDDALFDLALARLEARMPAYFYLGSDGPEPAAVAGDGGNIEHFWSEPVSWPDGLSQETCRDNGHHAQFALGSALHVAEVAWNQGVDIYSGHAARFTAALELMASQLLSGAFNTCRETTPTANHFNTWEVGYNHYHNRAGIDLPNTKKLIAEKIRPGSVRASWNLVYETLTHADLPSPRQHNGGSK